MKSVTEISRTQALHLAPFFNTVFIYFVFVEEPHGELWTTLLKCTPIVCLICYVYLQGFGRTKDCKYSQRIMIGLILSCVGDALLNINWFEHGMGAFGLAQLCYITAFGWRPLKLFIAIPLVVGGTTMIAVMLKRLDEVLIVGVPIYTILLLTMCWRSLARAAHKKDSISFFCAFGSLLFVISDACISVNMFLTEIPNANFWIMLTYYVAQFAIALSTVSEKPSIIYQRRD